MEITAAGPAARPLRRDAERNRRRILDAAAELFADRGLGVSLDDVAHHAEVGIGTVYRRFPDKDALIDALFEDQFDAVVALAEQALLVEDGWAALEQFVTRTVEMQAQNRGLKELLLGERTLGPGGCGARGRDRIEPLARRLVARAQEQGALRADFRAEDIPLLQVMVAAVADYTRDVAPEAWRRHLTIVLDGLRTRRDAPTPLPEPALSPDGLSDVIRRSGTRH